MIRPPINYYVEVARYKTGPLVKGEGPGMLEIACFSYDVF